MFMCRLFVITSTVGIAKNKITNILNLPQHNTPLKVVLVFIIKANINIKLTDTKANSKTLCTVVKSVKYLTIHSTI